ncbi:protein kinase [Ilyonectria robusta]
MSSSPVGLNTNEPETLAEHGFIELLDGGNQFISREMWMERPQSVVIATEIRQALKAAGVSSSSQRNFLSITKLGEIINHSDISKLIDALKSCSDLSPSEKKQLVNKICFVKDNPPCSAYKRIVAALIKNEREEDIRSVVKESFSDDYLTTGCFDDNFLLRDERTGRACQTMQKWNLETRKKFRKSIDKFNAPVFMRPSDPGVYHYVLDDRVVLPFEIIPSAHGANGDTIDQLSRSGNGSDNQGGFSDIKCVKIHADHHRFGTYDVPHEDGFFAVKTLNSRERNEFDKEVNVMLRFTHRTDKQLVKLLATYEQREKDGIRYHLIFPWATCNVKTFWRELRPIDRRDLSLIRWISSQLFAVGESLAYLHDEYALNPPLDRQEVWGRHGDIKASNFLVFKDPSHKSSKGSIFMADFGLSRFHREHSRSQVKPDQASASKRAPESDTTGGTFSRKSDIWTLGVFFLEFVTWYLMGYDVVCYDFPAAREEEDLGGTVTDTLFRIREEENIRTAAVKPQVTKWIKDLHGSADATHYVHDLLNLIEEKMLVIDKDSRIKAIDLKSKLDVMRKKCMDDEKYITQSCGCEKTAN